MPVKVFGYSERGMINSFIHEIKYATDGVVLLRDVLALCTFPFENPKPDFSKIENAQIIIEQSFSDFGDLDVLFLLDDTDGRKHSIFLEAKVKTSQKGGWLITDEWGKFTGSLRHPDGKHSSNLFVQLYRKQQLVRHCLGQKLPPDAVSNLWRIGTNNVVLRATDLLKPYVKDARFLALLPDSLDNVNRFFTQTLGVFNPPGTTLPAWDSGQWGYLTWGQFEAHCRQKSTDWEQTLGNFQYNHGQIHSVQIALNPNPGPTIPLRPSVQPPQPPVSYVPASRDICTLNDGRRVVIVRTGNNNHRYRFLVDEMVDPISESFLASTLELFPTATTYFGQMYPTAGYGYMYQGREVIVAQGGPEKSRVRWADDPEQAFLVFNHDLDLIT